MQIKCFEAEDMTEALRLVKREFGDDAVILSAREVRPKGFFSALRKKLVEIRAAADYPVSKEQKNESFSGVLEQQIDEASSSDRVSLSMLSESGDGVHEDNGVFAQHEPQPPRLADRPRRKDQFLKWPGTSPPISTADTNVQPTTQNISLKRETVRLQMSTPAPSHPIRVADPFFRGPEACSVVALVGPPGSGKSTTAAKLAWRCRVIEKKKVGMICLDRYRVAANSLLERVARIMNIPLSVVRDTEEMQSTLTRMDNVDVILIDTPGIGRSDESMMDDVCRLLRAAQPDETHLVVNATIREEVLAATIEAFSSTAANRLLLTHWDEDGCGSVFDRLNRHHLPASFYADGANLFEDLKSIVDVDHSQTQPRVPVDSGRVKAFPGGYGHCFSDAVIDPAELASHPYLANRNSELFHQPECKSVKRINVQNIVAFDSVEEAIDEGFKPCRACCDIGMIRKSVPVSLWKPRARAI